MEGKIKWYRRDKGYGFIVGNDEEDYFMHHSALPEEQQDVRESDDIKVSFEIKEGRDGRPQATDIKFQEGNKEEETSEKTSEEETEA